MKTLAKWIKRAVKHVVDPDREERIEEISILLQRELQNAKEAFSIQAFVDRVNYTVPDVEIAKRLAFRRILERAWKDDQVTEAERTTLHWVIDRLAIPKCEAAAIQQEVARERFAAALAQAMDDGMLDDDEAKFLEKIAGAVGLTLGDFVGSFFRLEGERFLAGIFSACTEEGALSDEVWKRLVATTERLGLSRQSLADAIRPQAERFVEHVLADAKSDGKLTEKEEESLAALICKLDLSLPFCKYVEQHVDALRTIRQAAQGKLPTITAPRGLTIRSGEIVHYFAPVTWLQKRVLKNGERWDEHMGSLMVTDNRLIFSSDTRSFDVRFGRIVSHAGRAGVIYLQRMEKPESIIRISEIEAVAYAILEAAIALSNQTRLANEGGKPSRRIPREVRQRVWQRYGGRCAECGASQYLEFDHIIPLAKGGSNSDANVQLLCRGCNSKKSDLI